MTLPPFLLGAALLFWGWQTGWLAVAAMIAVVLEGSRLTDWRWDLSREDFRRIARGCGLLLAGMIAYLIVTHPASGTGVTAATRALRQWLPLAALPLVAAQIYSTSDMIDVDVLRIFSRRQSRTAADADSAFQFTLAPPFFALCLLSAGFTESRSPWFYPVMCLLIIWSLWAIRPRQRSTVLWGGLLVLAAALGYAGHTGLHALRGLVEDAATRWIINMSGGGGDPFRAQTAIGTIGELKESDRIVLRVDAPVQSSTPLLIRLASYDLYQSSLKGLDGSSSRSVWLARESAFSDLPPLADGTTWPLQDEPAAHQQVAVALSLANGKGLLPLPNGTAQVGGLPVGKLQRNRLGAVQVDDGPGLVLYRVRFSADGSHEAAPSATDRTIAPNEYGLISKIATEIGLDAMTPHQALQAVKAYFHGQFTYATFQPDRPPGATPMEDFLLRTKAGHCEYFATATVLLLRAAGIPARYATGYSVQEFSRLENQYVVRDRHTHAWALAYLNGVWQEVDTTPATWFGVESGLAAWWRPAADLWSWVMFQFSKWRWGERTSDPATALLWIMIPLGLLAVWRFVRARQGARVTAARGPDSSARAWPGQDSEWYALERHLRAGGWGRQPWETWPDWLRRVGEGQGIPVVDGFQETLSLHRRYRFDPNGLGHDERASLRASVQGCLNRLRDRTHSRSG